MKNDPPSTAPVPSDYFQEGDSSMTSGHALRRGLPQRQARRWALMRLLTWSAVVIWACLCFAVIYYAPSMSGRFFDWPMHFWMAAEGALFAFLCLIFVFAWWAEYLEERWRDQDGVVVRASGVISGRIRGKARRPVRGRSR